jgi:GRIP domain
MIANNAVVLLEEEGVNQERPSVPATNSVEAPGEHSTGRICISEDINLNYLRCVVAHCLTLSPESTERRSLIPVLGALLNFED